MFKRTVAIMAFTAALLFSGAGQSTPLDINAVDPAPTGSPPLLAAPPGTTAVAGRILAVDGSPLRDVAVSDGASSAVTDEYGRYLLKGVNAGASIIIIDARHVPVTGVKGSDFGYYEVRETAESGKTRNLPYTNWLTPIDHKHDVVINQPLREPMSITTPAIPGLELRLPKGAVLTDPDGLSVKHIGLTKIDTRRPPYPFPRHIRVPIYFTAQPGGTVISSADGTWLGAQIVYPNYWHDVPGARGRFWRYQPDVGGWSLYGNGTVDRSARQVLPDSSTRIYELTGAMFDSQNSPPQDQPNCNCQNQGAGDPVDLGSGVFHDQFTDLTVNDVLPISITRTYQSDDFQTRAFGTGMNLSYDMYLGFTPNDVQWNGALLVLPNGATIPFSGPGGCFDPGVGCQTYPQLISTKPGRFYNAHLTWVGQANVGDGSIACCWQLTTRDGSSYFFGDEGPLYAISDRFGNTISLTRQNTAGQEDEQGNITQITSPNGRHIYLQWNYVNTGGTVTFGTLKSASDDAGRSVSYAYQTGTTGNQLLQYFNDADGKQSQYVWPANNQLGYIIDANGHKPFQNTYCPSASCNGSTSPSPDPLGQVQSQTLPDGSVYQYTYSAAGSGTATTVSATLANNAANNPVSTTALFDSSGYELTYDRAVGTSVEEDTTDCYYSDTNNPTACPTSTSQPSACPANSGSLAQAVSDVIDNLSWKDSGGASHNGRDTHYSYDSMGNVTCTTYLYGTMDAVSYGIQYSPSYNLPILLTDPLGHSVSVLRPEPTETATAVTDANGLTTNFQYNNQGQLTLVIDPLNISTGITYDAGDVASITYALNDPLQRTTTYYTDVIGRRIRATDPLGNTSQFTYDPLYGVTAATDPAGETTTVSFDPVGNLAQVANANTGMSQGVTQFKYDSSNRLQQRIDPLGNSDFFTKYNGYGKLISGTDRNGNVVTYTYDALGRVSTVLFSDGSKDTYTWDAGDRILSVKEKVGSNTGAIVGRAYDALDRLTCESTNGNASTSCPVMNASYQTTEYAYDAASRLINRISTGQNQVTYGYDNGNRLTSILEPSPLGGAGGGPSAWGVTIQYDNDNRRHVVSYPSDRSGGTVQATLSWDNANQLDSISYANIPHTGSPTSIGNLSYNYDLDGRVVARGGTLFQPELPQAVGLVAYNAADRISSRTVGPSTATPIWDNNGNLVCDNGTGTWQSLTCTGSQYSWDSRNRLSAAVSPTAGNFTYTYDPFNRRLSNASGVSNGTTYGYSLWNVILETNIGTDTVTNVLTGPGLDERYTRLEGTGSSTSPINYLVDLLGSTLALTSAGAAQTYYAYDPFGVLVSTTGTSDTNRNAFTGRELDATGLQYHRNRYYNPTWGRFISEDPIGLASGTNRYLYGTDSPTNYGDPLGLWTVQVGFSGSYTAFGITANVSVGAVVDGRGDAGFSGSIGWGGGSGVGAWGGVGGAISDAQTICDLRGPFHEVGGSAGDAVGGAGGYFWGNGNNGPVRGVEAYIGPGAGASGAATTTNTWVAPVLTW